MTTPTSGIPEIFSMAGKRVIVTGGLSGFGRVVAESFVSQGADVGVIDWSAGKPGAPDLPGARVIQGDVSSPEITGVVHDLIAQLGGIDVVFANAGIGGGSRWSGDFQEIEDIDWEMWHNVMGVNLDGVIRTVGAAVPTMKQQRSGKIIMTASIAGLRGSGWTTLSYQASKAAVVMVVHGLALQLAPWGINVNGIAPGPMQTGLGDFLSTDTATRTMSGGIPLGRMGHASEILGPVQLLASEASSFMTGSVVSVDGGGTSGQALPPDFEIPS